MCVSILLLTMCKYPHFETARKLLGSSFVRKDAIVAERVSKVCVCVRERERERERVDAIVAQRVRKLSHKDHICLGFRV